MVSVARRGPRRPGLLDGGEVCHGELQLERAEGLGKPVAAAGSDQRYDVLTA